MCLGKIGGTEFGAQCLLQKDELMKRILIDWSKQKASYFLKANCHQFAHTLCKSVTGRVILERMGWEVHFIKRKKIQETDDHYVCLFNEQSKKRKSNLGHKNVDHWGIFDRISKQILSKYSAEIQNHLFETIQEPKKFTSKKEGPYQIVKNFLLQHGLLKNTDIALYILLILSFFQISSKLWNFYFNLLEIFIEQEDFLHNIDTLDSEYLQFFTEV